MVDIHFTIVKDHDHHCWRCDSYVNDSLDSVHYAESPTRACQKAEAYIDSDWLIHSYERKQQ